MTIDTPADVSLAKLHGIIETLMDITGVESPADLTEWAQDAVENVDSPEPHMVRVGGRFGPDDDSGTIAVLVYGDKDALLPFRQQLAELHPIGTAARLAKET